MVEITQLSGNTPGQSNFNRAMPGVVTTKAETLFRHGPKVLSMDADLWLGLLRH